MSASRLLASSADVFASRVDVDVKVEHWRIVVCARWSCSSPQPCGPKMAADTTGETMTVTRISIRLTWSGPSPAVRT
jgi:hypothetical protein